MASCYKSLTMVFRVKRLNHPTLRCLTIKLGKPWYKAFGKTTPLGWTIMMFTLSAGNNCILLYLTLYIIYKIKVMFSQNWYPRETSLLFTGRQMLCFMSVQKCIRFCIPEIQSWPEVKNTNMKFMKTQDKNTQISVYCIQHYCK